MCRTWCGALFLALATGVACSQDPEVAKRQYLAEGDQYMTGKKYTEAVLSYRNAVRLDERAGESRMKLADALLAAGDGQNGLRESVRAADLLPDNAEVQLRAGSLLLLAKQYPEARARAMTVLAKEPQNPRALILLGNSLAGLQELDAAIEQVEQAIDQDPLRTFSYENLGNLYIAKGDQDAAEGAFRRAVAATPKSVLAHVSLANYLWARGKRDEAERELKVAIEIEPTSTTANRALATLYLTQGKGKEAEPYLQAYAAESRTTEARVGLADYYISARMIPQAAEVLNALVKEADGFAPATLRLAGLDFAANRKPEAYAKVESVIAREPKNPMGLELKVRFLLADQKFPEALAAANALVEADPTSVRGRYLQAVGLEATGAIDEAITGFQAVLAARPAETAAQIKLARLHLVRRNYQGALSLAQQAVKARPQSVEAHLVYAQALFRTGDMTNAERELVMLAKAAPSSADVHAWLGLVHETQKNPGAARRAYERAFELNPQSSAALAGLVTTDLAEKRNASALARLATQLAARPNDPALVMMSAMTHTQLRDFDKAETAYRRVLELDANNLEAYTRLGALYVAQNRLDEAAKAFEEMTRRDPMPVAAETMLGTIKAVQKKPQEARRHFERALELNPRAAVAANNLAWDYANSDGNLDVALQLAQTAKAERPDVAQITDTLGWIYYKKGLTALAVSTLGEATRQEPSDPGIFYRLGLAYLQDGKKEEARTSLQHALKLNPKFSAADEVRRVLATIS